MDSEAAGFSGSSEALAGDVRSVCHLVTSPVFSIFFALSRSSGLGAGCLSSKLRRLSGICLSTLVPDTPGSEETPIIFWRSYDTCSSMVASEALVPRASGSNDRRSGSAPSESRSAQTATFPSSSSWDIQAVPPCVETLQRFARSHGFSSRVAKQIGFARRSSSRVGYQANGPYIDTGVIQKVIRSLDLLFLR